MLPPRPPSVPLGALLVALLSPLTFGSAAAFAPDFVRELDTMEWIGEFGPTENPFFGGLETPRPQLVDFDADGDLDLFVPEDRGQLRYYRNEGTEAAPDFRIVEDDFFGLHEFYFARFADLDSDGDYDALVEAPKYPEIVDDDERFRTGAFYYENVGTGLAPAFERRSARPDGYFADENGDRIPFDVTTPDFADIDSDGDLDLLMGDISGSIVFYRNVGTPTDPVFRFVSRSYQDVLIVFDSCIEELAGPQTLGEMLGLDDPGRHGFMLFSFHDANGDGRPDLFVGDEFNSNSYFLLNSGQASNPTFTCVTQEFFPNEIGAPGSFTQRLQSAWGDLDGDGDADAIVGGGAPNLEALWYFRNDGSPTFPSMTLVTPNYLPELDRGRNSALAVADLENDGLLDLYFAAGNTQRVTQYGNIGTAAEPGFALFLDEWLPVGTPSWIAPEFADIDGDEDLDLFLGSGSGGVRFFRNDGTRESPAFGVEIFDADNTFGDISTSLFGRHVSSISVPRAFDEDLDGDVDFVVGPWDNDEFATPLLFFRNDGTPDEYHFVLADANYGGVVMPAQSARPAFVDLDGDVDLDLVCGGENGTLRWWENVATRRDPTYVERGSFLGLDVGAESVPVFADIDADGDPDLFVGERGGGINFYRNAGGTNRNPTPFALEVPAPDAEIDGRALTHFTWGASTDPDGGSVAYELVVAPAPSAPEAEWLRFPVAGTQADVAIHVGDFRFRPEFVWTVRATDGDLGAPVPDWRAGVHATFDARHGVPPGDGPDDVVQKFTVAPRAFEFASPYPSPTRGETNFEFVLPAAGPVRIETFDVRGRLVGRVANRSFPAGRHVVPWAGETLQGTVAGPGVYLVRLEYAGRSETRRLVRIP